MKHHFSLYTILLCVGLLLATQYASAGQRNKRLDSKNKPITYRLFMQNDRANIAFPENEESDSTGKGHFITESVTFQNEDNYSAILEGIQNEEVGSGSLTEVHKLGEVKVIAKRRFVPERDGRLNISFLVFVPKGLISQDWRLMLTPMILNPDSVIELNRIIIKGENFAAKQKSDSLKYQRYVESLVDKDDYVNRYLDSLNIRRDMDKQLDVFWNLYHKEWAKQTKYLEWEDMMLKRYGRANLMQKTSLLELEQELRRKAWFEGKQNTISGVGDTNVDNKYAKKFEQKAKFWPKYKIRRELTRNKLPKKYRQYFGVDVRPENLTNYVLTPSDSAEIANNRYLFGEIAKNEERIENVDKVHTSTIIFPREENVHIDSIANSDADFEYLYEFSYPVTGSGHDVVITMKGMIEAVDRSSYELNGADTLTYMVSSLTQLVDTTLVTKETQFYRNMYDKITIFPKFRTEAWTFDVNYMDNKEQMDSVLNSAERLVVERKLQLDSLEIKMFSDLNGTFNTSANLTINRSDAIKEYLIHNNRGLIEESQDNIKSIFGGEDWQKLAELIQRTANIKHKDEILTLMKTATDPDQTKQEIKELYAEDYEEIERTIFPKLVRSEVMIYISRPEMAAADSVHSEYRPDYAEGVRLLQHRQYWEALEILNKYPDYNLALCLTIMGYNGKAYDVLEQLPSNANVEYLKAIVLVRLGREEQAAEHLLNACNLDIVKLSRAELDSETQGLLYKYNIKESVYESQASVEESEANVEESEVSVEGSEANVEESEASVEGSEANVEESEVSVEGSEANVEESEASVEEGEANVEESEANIEKESLEE